MAANKAEDATAEGDAEKESALQLIREMESEIEGKYHRMGVRDEATVRNMTQQVFTYFAPAVNGLRADLKTLVKTRAKEIRAAWLETVRSEIESS